MKFLSIVFATLFVATAGYAQLSTSKLFGNHMVLQRNHIIPVWGHSEKKARVTVIINGQMAAARADDNGNWSVNLQPMKEGGPYVMNVASGKELISYSDVMLGEGWLCSGQSNMEFQLRNAYGYKAEQKVAEKIAVRQFHVQDKVSLIPENEVAGG